MLTPQSFDFFATGSPFRRNVRSVALSSNFGSVPASWIFITSPMIWQMRGPRNRRLLKTVTTPRSFRLRPLEIALARLWLILWLNLNCRSRLLICKNGEGCANLLETGALSCNEFYALVWKRDVIDYTELASKRWVERLSMVRIAADMGLGRTAVIRHLGKIRCNPDLVEDGQVRLRIHRTLYKFMGS